MKRSAINNAAQKYLAIRAAVLKWGPSGAPDEEAARTKIATRAGAEISEVQMSEHHRLSMDDLWNHLKVFPCWTNVRAQTGSERVRDIRRYRVADDYKALVGATSMSHPWQVTASSNRKSYDAVGFAAKEFTSRTGAYATQTHKTKPEIPYRWCQLADLLNSAPSAQMMSAAEFFDFLSPGYAQSISANGVKSDALWEIVDKLARVLGRITTLHALMEYGFPVAKPDIWLVRILNYLGWLNGVSAKRFEKGDRDTCETVFSFLLKVAVEAELLTGEGHTIRQVDWWIAKFGMDVEPMAGIYSSPALLLAINSL